MAVIDAGEPRTWLRMRGIQHDWMCCGVVPESAERTARDSFFANPEWGTPSAAFMWEKETWTSEWDCESETKVFACLYPNGRVLDVRFNKSGTRIGQYPAKGAS